MSKRMRVGMVAAVAATATLAGVATAGATPSGPGVTGKTIAQTTVGGKDYLLRQITIPAGQSTGWHFHDGTLYGYVEKGTLSHFDSTCKSDGVYEAGSALTEPSGAQNVHIGRNLGTTPVVLDVLYVLPHGAPLSEDAPNPGCDFQ
ncbi:cupin domain-containing protein [Streptomyces sp. NBC_01808]|uniref:cupin domain-containing protein n=1 Tax=Streptomyces sp. NBC_01808 TaxID=2975947 RepID=UPI002DDADF11|nr:cupin domain-containing protein [Streptomyces sp. NBC_01808]WSA41140.1 cupin domain-containing protein [Streptomyces sp. NBC_01808]